MDDIDQRLLRETFRIARAARGRGNRPFGALLAGPDRTVLLEAEDDVVLSGDPLAHADATLLRRAARQFDRDVLRASTLYTSAEPCAMCAGAIFWSGVGRVIFGLSTARLLEMSGPAADGRLAVPCRAVLAQGRPLVEVTGPLFQAEASDSHAGYWSAATRAADRAVQVATGR